ncbi:hypothetical protein Nmel_005963 [Mimus melanotis]
MIMNLSQLTDLSVEECCDKGVEWANENRICASLPLISESRECSHQLSRNMPECSPENPEP